MLGVGQHEWHVEIQLQLCRALVIDFMLRRVRNRQCYYYEGRSINKFQTAPFHQFLK